MLLSNNKHKWSIDGMNWVAPTPYDGYEAPPPDYRKELPDHIEVDQPTTGHVTPHRA